MSKTYLDYTPEERDRLRGLWFDCDDTYGEKHRLIYLGVSESGRNALLWDPEPEAPLRTVHWDIEAYGHQLIPRLDLGSGWPNGEGL